MNQFKVFHSSVDPYTNKKIGLYPLSNQQQILRCIYKSCIVISEPYFHNLEFRIKLLYKIRKLLNNTKSQFANLISKETGKPIKYSYLEINYCLELLRLAAEEMIAQHLNKEYQKPENYQSSLIMESKFNDREVVVGLGSYRYPLSFICSTFVNSIVMGNSCIIKPSSKAPGPAFLFKKLVKEAHNSLLNKKIYPLNYFHIILSSFEDIDYLIKHPQIKKIHYSGKKIHYLNLKSKYPMKDFILDESFPCTVILDSFINLNKTTKYLASAISAFSGQFKFPIKRIFIQNDIYLDFKQDLLNELEKVKIGDPLDQGTVSGPIINRRNRDSVLTLAHRLKQTGHTILKGGSFQGNLIEPIIIEENKLSLKNQKLDLPGSLVSIQPYSNFEYILRSGHNDFEDQLISLFTENIHKIQKMYSLINSGLLIINEIPTFSFHLPNLPKISFNKKDKKVLFIRNSF
jgi:acyl-CoA reductase-like NAD-dependent aldehyde dehydrogenase